MGLMRLCVNICGVDTNTRARGSEVEVWSSVVCHVRVLRLLRGKDYGERNRPPRSIMLKMLLNVIRSNRCVIQSGQEMVACLLCTVEKVFTSCG